MWRYEEGKDKYLGVFNIQMLFIAMDLDEIIWRGNVERNLDRQEKDTLGLLHQLEASKGKKKRQQ